MGKLHELLAVEKNVSNVSAKLFTDTMEKFKRVESFFQGHIKTLAMLSDSPENKALEAAAKEEKALNTNVFDTLDYFFQFWNKTEDLLFQKNKTNQSAVADIEFNGHIIATSVPVDELMGLENRLTLLRGVIATAPTLDASREWKKDDTLNPNIWVSAKEEVTTKTEKVMTAVTLSPATDKFPAQIEKVSKDVVVGSFSIKRFSGAITSLQKANALGVIDGLISEVKKARTRANDIPAVNDLIGARISGLIMDCLK